MVKIRKPKKENKEVLSIENPEVLNETISKSEQFINKNKNIIFSVLGIILIVLLSFSVFSFLKTNQNTIAQE